MNIAVDYHNLLCQGIRIFMLYPKIDKHNLWMHFKWLPFVHYIYIYSHFLLDFAIFLLFRFGFWVYTGLFRVVSCGLPDWHMAGDSCCTKLGFLLLCYPRHREEEQNRRRQWTLASVDTVFNPLILVESAAPLSNHLFPQHFWKHGISLRLYS